MRGDLAQRDTGRQGEEEESTQAPVDQSKEDGWRWKPFKIETWTWLSS